MFQFLKKNNKILYVSILSVLVVCLLLAYVPGLSALASWITPPVALFLGLVFALLCGQAYPKFNKKVSKKLLQYSVVGLGFAMNLHASLASGKEGMMFTIVSVVGAGAAYGEEALQVATTIKLTRALWIIPLALVTSFIFKSKGQKISIPWFILWFIVAVLINTYLLDSVPEVGKVISGLARKGLIITMFFIGASLSTDVLKSVGVKPLVQGVLLWLVISVGSLAYILWR